MPRQADLDAFYGLLDEAAQRQGGPRRLAACDGKMSWPERGVYFFFEPGETRTTAAHQPRVVRVGTHALNPSKTTLWNRLSQHRGTLSPLGGNHRGSIFRLLAGQALIARQPALDPTPTAPTWGKGSTASREVRLRERPHEARVSAYLGAMTVVVLSVPDDPGPDSARGVIERNSIALLSSYRQPAPDQPSAAWLGRYSTRERVRKSGLWNNNHVDESYDPAFLDLLADLLA